MSSPDYCREIEAYLCRKNDGHLIRIVGPAFELVSKWETDGVPMKVAFEGIDRYFERYYRQPGRRRPVRIDFCDADVRDVFDEWRRAVLQAGASATDDAVGHGVSLPKHLERAVLRLTSARATGALGVEMDTLIDRVAGELDTARASSGGLRGAARQALVARLEALDAELLQAVRAGLDEQARRALEVDAEDELSGFRATMTDETYGRARELAINRIVRDRFKLPTVSY